jgi:transcriptional regulator with PAS, ATPase and Fis domain
MEIIARDTDSAVARMLDSFEHPAILVASDYRILATNDLYRDNFGLIDTQGPSHCYQVSHGYDRPCDQSGENCPLAAATASGSRERVLHIHQTPRGEEHVDVEMLPIFDDSGQLQYFVELLKPVPTSKDGRRSMVGSSPPFNKMLGLISRVGPSDAAVLLLGESGTGKELAASAIHEASLRSDKALVTLECAGLTETLFESELFGHVKGAFTGANYTRQGMVDAADGGTLFLDEIGDIPYPLQVKLLRLLETGTFRAVGSTEVKQADFRLVCATHKNLEQMVEQGAFRQDLYYRINVFPIHIPSLSERRDDIPALARMMLKGASGSKTYHLTESAMSMLRSHDYRGNIRELRNLLSRAVILANTNVIDQDIMGQCLDPEGMSSPDLRTEPDLKSMEINYLHKLMQVYDGDKARVAQIAGISVRSLYRKLQGDAGEDEPDN